LQTLAQRSGQEGGLIVPALSLTAAVQRYRNDGIQVEVTRRQSVPAICHQSPQQRSQASQVLVLESVNRLAQRSAVNRIGSMPVELEWGTLAASANSRAIAAGLGAG
jgi:hypothetical protein